MIDNMTGRCASKWDTAWKWALTDATSKRIISEIITPRFKEGDFYGGITAGVERMIGVIDGEPLPPPQRNAAGDADIRQLLPDHRAARDRRG